MERVLEKLKSVDKNKQLVAAELVKQCEREPAFIEKILNERKSLDDCWEYIKYLARKQVSGNAAVVDDATVYGWATHYFDEEELEDWKKPTKQAPAKQKNVTKAKPATEEEVYDDDGVDQDDNDENIEGNDSDDDEKSEGPKASKPKGNQQQSPSRKQPKGVAEGQISLF